MFKSLQDLLVSHDYSDHTAICYDDGERKAYVTYSDLLQSSLELTDSLRKCVGDNKLIALYSPPSVDMFVAILGILEVPAAYVPIALNQPGKDKMKILEHLWISTVVVHYKVLQEFLTLPWHSTAELHYKLSCGELFVYSVITYTNEVSLWEKMQSRVPEELAYVMTTSGTTGLPKIVRVPHCCILPNIVDLRQRFKLSSDDLVFNAAPYTFDPSVVEMFLAFSSGATLLVVPEAIKASPARLATVLCHRNFPTIIQATPSLVCSLGSDMIHDKLLAPQSSLRVLAFGGEACPSLATLAQWQHHSNSTRIFNIYGITEVSSWAMCYELSQALYREQCNDDVLTGDSNNPLNNTVPLGDPLLDTCIELRDEQGNIVTCGNGEIWIGGHSRVCLLDDEEHRIAGTMRPTGDHGGYRSDGQLCYIGRIDKQIKRLGHRINLDRIQQIISNISIVKTCAIVSCSSDQHNKLWGDNYTTLLLFAVPNTHNNSDDLLHELHSKMHQLLPTYCIPDSVVLMDTLPMTDHGKVDTSSLLMKYNDKNLHNECSDVQNDHFTSVELVELWITSLAKAVGVDGWKSDVNFTQCGGDSFQLVRIINMLDENLGTKVSGMLGEFMETALNKSLHNVAVFLFEQLNCHHITTEETNIDDTILAVPVAKKQKLSTDVMSGTRQIELRKGHFYVNNKVMMPRLYHALEVTSSMLLTLEVSWTVDTQKCVDASPLIVSWSNGGDDSWLTYIGSHSGLFFAINVLSGNAVWQVLLTDRIMSSAALSACGKYVIVGSYDGYLHVLDALTGVTYWTIGVSSEPIKSSPSVDRATSLVWFGSHDHHLYSVDIKNKKIVHKLSINGGIIMSSPLIDVQQRQLYVTTLAGHVVAINCDSTEVVWRYKFAKPVFTSASLLHDHSIIVGCVNGELVKLTPDGTMVGKLCSNKAIFESACPYTLYTTHGNTIVCNDNDSQVDTVNVKHWNGILELGAASHDAYDHSQDLFLFGDHDCSLHSITKDMCSNWKIKLDSAIGSCPFIGSLILPQGDLAICCCCTVNGNLFILDLATGRTLTTMKLPGEIFSSPLIIGDRIVIGCRDNNVYCLKVNTKL